MAHQISANSFRLGKTYLWNNNSILLKNTNNLTQNRSSVEGINSILNSILKKNKCLLVKSNITVNNYTGSPTIKVLYYPFFYYSMRAFKKKNSNMSYPKLSDVKKLFLNKVHYFSNKETGILKKTWKFRHNIFLNRFFSSRKKLWFTKYLHKAFFKGAKSKNYSKLKKYHAYSQLIKKQHRLYALKHNKKKSILLNKNVLSFILSKKLGYRILVKPLNIYNYLALKLKNLNLYNYKQIYFKDYFFFHRRVNKYFYDFINLFTLMCYFPNISQIISKLIQHSLEKMHKQRIKPKIFFYFLDHLIKKLPRLRLTFSSVRLIITGKLRGGTARTKSYSAGFGSLPKQTLSSNIFYNFTNIESKYGSFGVKFLAQKKQ